MLRCQIFWNELNFIDYEESYIDQTIKTEDQAGKALHSTRASQSERKVAPEANKKLSQFYEALVKALKKSKLPTDSRMTKWIAETDNIHMATHMIFNSLNMDPLLK